MRSQRAQRGGFSSEQAAVAADLPAELDLCLIHVVDPHVGPGQAAQLRDPRARERRDDEQRPKRLVGGSDRLFERLADEDRATLALGELRSL